MRQAYLISAASAYKFVLLLFFLDGQLYFHLRPLIVMNLSSPESSPRRGEEDSFEEYPDYIEAVNVSLRRISKNH